MRCRRRVSVVALLAAASLAFLTLGGPYAAAAQSPAPTAKDAGAVIEVGPEQQRNVSLTIYDNLALVRDERIVSLNQGTSRVRFSQVAMNLDPSSVRLVSLTAPGDLKVLEQSFEYDLASRDRVLTKYIGKEVEVNQDGTIRPARLLAVDSQGQLVVEMQDDRIVFVPLSAVQLPELSSGLVLEPTLVWCVDARSAADHVVEADYLTHGISWRADYICVLDAKERLASIDGWVTLDNKSGATYPNASLKLVAGEVRTAQDQVAFKALQVPAAAMLAEARVEEQPVFEYHSYELTRRTTLADNEQKQVGLLSAAGVPISKSYVFEASDGSYGYETYAGKKETGNVKVIVEFQNKASAGLGIPLPAGKVRVYKASDDKRIDLVGEDTIEHTPRDETVRLYVGNAFDLVGERTVTDYKKTGVNSYEEACSIKLRNHKDEDVEITALERFEGEWTILSCVPSSYQKLDANTAAFKVKVPKGKEVEILYRVRVIGG